MSHKGEFQERIDNLSVGNEFPLSESGREKLKTVSKTPLISHYGGPKDDGVRKMVEKVEFKEPERLKIVYIERQRDLVKISWIAKANQGLDFQDKEPNHVQGTPIGNQVRIYTEIYLYSIGEYVNLER